MAKNSKMLLEENEKLQKENAALLQQLHGAREVIKLIKSGNIDALVNTDEKDLKIYTANTADKIYRILIEEMHEGAVTLNKDGIILYSNTYFAKMVGLPLHKVLGQKFENFIDAASKKHYDEAFLQGWTEHVQAEIYVCAKSGNCIPVLMSVNNLQLDNNSVLSIIITDLTLQNKNQDELRYRARQVEQNYLALELANKELAHQNEEKEKRAAELIIANRKLVFYNNEKEKRAAELILANEELEYQNEEKEKRAQELIIANKELAFQNVEKERRAAELILANEELAYQNEEKERRAAELIIANKELAFQNQEKEKRAAELISANNDFKLAEEQFRLVVESAPNALVLVNNKGLIMLVNNETEKLFGYKRSELIGKKLEILIPERYRNLHVKQRDDFLKKPVTREMGAGRELFALHKNGTEIQVEIGLNPLKTSKGKMVLASILDITERKLYETNLINHNKELAFQNEEKEKRAEELSVAYKELKQAEEYQEEYIKGLEGMMFMTSHKLRVPITNLLGISEILEQLLNSPEKLKKMVNYIKDSATKLDGFTKELSVFMEDLEQKGKK